MSADVAVTTDCELQRTGPARRKTAEQVAGAGPAGHLGNQVGEFRRGGVGVNQRGMRLEAAHLCTAQRRYAGEHAVLVARQRAQHQADAGLVEILRVVGRNADADGARPVGHLGQLCTQVREDVLRIGAIVVGDVEQPEGRRRRVIGQGHLCSQLGEHEPGRHAPLGMGGVTGGKQFHGFSVLRPGVWMPRRVSWRMFWLPRRPPGQRVLSFLQRAHCWL